VLSYKNHRDPFQHTVFNPISVVMVVLKKGLPQFWIDLDSLPLSAHVSFSLFFVLNLSDHIRFQRPTFADNLAPCSCAWLSACAGRQTCSASFAHTPHGSIPCRSSDAREGHW